MLSKPYSVELELYADSNRKVKSTRVLYYSGDQDVYPIQIYLRSGGRSYAIPEGARAFINFKRKSGVVDKVQAEVSNHLQGLVIYDIVGSEISEPGEVTVSVELQTANQRLTWQGFNLLVVRSIDSSGSVPPEPWTQWTTGINAELIDHSKRIIDLEAQPPGGGVSKAYVDQQDALMLATAKTFADQQDLVVLATAKAYTDEHAGTVKVGEVTTETLAAEFLADVSITESLTGLNFNFGIPRGPKGEDGRQGEIGPQGLQGIPGVRGLQGEVGPAGPQGEQGLQGIQGIPGTQGIPGIQGEQGPPGVPGRDGRDGTGVNILGSFDSYEDLITAHPTANAGDAYLVSGVLYVWSQADQIWVNVGQIQGPQGDPGIPGSPGPQGPQGEVGPQGIQGPQGEQGIQGIQGEQGLTGPPGEQGIQGPKGNDGEKGEQGPQGPVGPEGPAGPKGDQGIQGEQGIQGIPGEQGPVGLEGPQGIQGNTGPQGIQGEIGPQGPQGIKGDIGPEGPQGPKGDPGEGIEEAPVDGKQYARKNAAWAEVQGGGGGSLPAFVYQCTGVADDVAIQTIINDFFSSGTAMSIKLIISGTMGLTASPANNAQIRLSASNSRGAVCVLDFFDCNIPEIVEAGVSFLSISNDTIKIKVFGLSVKTAGVAVLGYSYCHFENCNVTGVKVQYGGNNTFVSCTIEGRTNYGVELSTGTIKNTFINCIITSNAKAAAWVYGRYSKFANCTINSDDAVSAYAYGDYSNFTSCTIGSSSNIKSSAYAVQVANGRNHVFVGCTIEKSAGTVVYITNTNIHSVFFTNCLINSNGGNAVQSTGSANCIFESCTIRGTTNGINVSTSNTGSEIKLSNCFIKGTNEDIQQTSAEATLKWYIVGNSFSQGNIIVDGAARIAYKLNDNIYFPQYSNKFSRTINP